MIDNGPEASMANQPAHNSQWLLYLLIAIIALAPLPMGSNLPLPASLLALSVGLLLFVWLFREMWKPENGSPLSRSIELIKVPGLLFLVTLLWIFMQWLPLGLFSHPLWEAASSVLEKDIPGRISINPAATMNALMMLVTYGAVFWLTYLTTKGSKSAQIGRNAIVLIGAGYALLGYIIFFGGRDGVFEGVFSHHIEGFSSTFVNRNSYATFAGLSLLCAASLFTERLRPVLDLARPAKQKVALLIETLVMRSGWVTASVILIFFSLFLTESRAGIASTMIGLVVLITLQMKRGRGRWRQVMTAVSIGVVLGGIGLMLAGKGFVDRLEQDGLSLERGGGMRQTIFSTTVEAIRSAPWTGTGYGTYGDAIEAYRGNDSGIFHLWEKAHNTFLENALELGLPAAGLLLLSVIWLVAICYRGVNERKSGRSFPAIGVAASVLVGLHGMLDFSLQIPAIALLYSFMLGLAVAQARSPRGRRA